MLSLAWKAARALWPRIKLLPLRAAVAQWRREGRRVGLVPTMGALHEGHLSLVRTAKERCDRIVASLFVNPKQFAPHEDFDRYPRNEAGDASLLASAGCDLLFAPPGAVMYPDGHATNVIVTSVSTPLEGEMRPHFFGGVATVVTKLLLQCLPDAAFFGEKDYQQLQVIKQLARDLDIPVEIVAGPTVREASGLAMSTRNKYLSEAARETALRIPSAIAAGQSVSERGADAVVNVARSILEAPADVEVDVQYVVVTDPLMGPAPAAGGSRRPAWRVASSSARRHPRARRAAAHRSSLRNPSPS